MSRLLFLMLAMLWMPVSASAAAADDRATALVDVAWLKANIERPDLIVLDVRNKLGDDSRETYLKGHIPGAIHSDYLTDGWRTEVDGVGGQLPIVIQLESLIGNLGISNDDHVVIVAGGKSALDMGSATRVYFTFKVLGHDLVSVLNGGYRAYLADPANPVETGAVERPATIFAAEFRPELLASREEVAAASAEGAVLVDFRPAEQYLGKSKHEWSRVAGTIPGAVSVPEEELTEQGGKLVSGGQAAALLERVGVRPQDEVIAFCNTGHWASLGWFVSHEILGNNAARLYDGSMVDWTADPARPVVRGASDSSPPVAQGGS